MDLTDEELGPTQKNGNDGEQNEVEVVQDKTKKPNAEKKGNGVLDTVPSGSNPASFRNLRSGAIVVRGARDQIDKAAGTLAARIAEARDLMEEDMSEGEAKSHAARLLAMERGLQEASQIFQGHLDNGIDAVSASIPDQQEFLYDSLTKPMPGLTKRLRLRDNPPPAELLQIAAEHLGDLRTVRKTLEDEDRISTRSSSRTSQRTAVSQPLGDVPLAVTTPRLERSFQAAVAQRQLNGPIEARVRNGWQGERVASPVISNVANILQRRVRTALSPAPELPGRQFMHGGFHPGRHQSNNQFSATTFETVRLQPPTFSGKPEDWTTFWAYFQRAVDDKPIPGVEKQLHLLRCLKEGSPARRTVEVYPPSDGNYPVVVQLLRERFGDTDDLQRAIRAQLLHLSPAKDNVNSLTTVVDEFERGVCQLEQLGANVDDASFGPLLESKLPVRILTELRIRESMMGLKWSVREFRRAVTAQVRCMRSAESALAAMKEPEVRTDHRADRDQRERGARGGREHFNRAFLVRDGAKVGNLPEAARHREERQFSGQNVPPATNNASKPINQKKGISAPPNGFSCSLCFKSDHRPSECRTYSTAQARRKRIIDQRRCIRCLASDHAFDQCPRMSRCRRCQKDDHHWLLCWNGQKTENRSMLVSQAGGTSRRDHPREQERDGDPPQQQQQWSKREAQMPPEDQRAFTTVGQCLPAHLMICTAVAAPEGRGKACLTTLLLDPGSHVDCAETGLIRQLKLSPMGRRPLTVQVFGGQKKRIPSATYRLRLKRLDGAWETIEVSEVPQICTPIKTELIKPGLSPGGNMQMVTMVTQPQLLIGIRKFWDYVIGFRKSEKGTYIIDTVFGAVSCGEDFQMNSGTSPAPSVLMTLPCGEDGRDQMPPISAVEQFWSLEAIGISDDPTEDADSEAVIQFEQSVHQLNDGRYSIRLPWRAVHPPLPSNFHLSYRRLMTMLQRFQKVPEVLKQYTAVINEQISNGIIEETKIGGEREHFIPHQAVITPKKLRVVYDASAHVKGMPSLNDCLLRGPVWLPDLAGMLIRFRGCRVPVIADVEKAFLMVGIEEDDRNVCKFLWVRDPSLPLSTDNLVPYRFRRLAFGLTPSPFCLAAVVRHHLRKYDSTFAEQLIRDTYVDNVLIPADSVEEAAEKARTAKKMFSEARMNLREFLSNDKGLNDSFSEADFLGKTTVKVLGLEWDAETDSIRMAYPGTEPGAPSNLTRRKVLSCIASIFDPLGLVNPATLKAKMFFQRLWDDHHEWDTPLPSHERREWEQILASWEGRFNLVPRGVTAGAAQPVQLHVFTDASEMAYAAAAYLRIEQTGGTKSRLIMAKSRLKPKKAAASFTIPRMELMGILLGVRLAAFIRKQLHLPLVEEHLWSDSLIALHWIRGSSPQPQFIANRLLEIRKAATITFHHVRTGENSADLATRGVDPAQLQETELWWNGPTWLRRSREEWPNELCFEADQNGHEHSDASSTALLVRDEQPDQRDEFPSFLLNRFSRWSKVARIAAWMLRFAYKIRERIRAREGEKEETEAKGITSKTLTSNDVNLAKLALIRMVQHDSIMPKSVQIELDQRGVKILVSRIGQCEEPEVSKPVVLPRKSRLATLIMEDIHERLHHAGVDGTLSEFLRGWWTPGARQQARRMIGTCRRCRRMQGAPYPLPLMPPLPADRVQRRLPFESVGLDYLGPTLTLNDDGQRQKAWVLLITCLTTRAIYIDATRDLSALSFISVLRRFIARRGVPSRILSDNAPTFTVVGKALEDFGISNGDPLAFADGRGIKWRFTPQHTPWAGGVFERAVQLVKRALQKTLGGTILAYELFSTLLAEIEATVNSRPITYVNTDAGELYPLRPIDFIQENNRLLVELPALPPEQNRKDPPYVQLTRQWRQSQQRLEHFWRRWHREYLMALREKAGWTHTARRVNAPGSPKIGDVVLIEDKFHARNLWPVGRVVELKGSEGQIRSVMIKMTNGRIWGRPVNKISPLEEAPREQEDGKFPEGRAHEVEEVQAVPAVRDANREIRNDSFVAERLIHRLAKNQDDRSIDPSAVSKNVVMAPQAGAKKRESSTFPNLPQSDGEIYQGISFERPGPPYHHAKFQPDRTYQPGGDAFCAEAPAEDVQAVQPPEEAIADPETLSKDKREPAQTRTNEDDSLGPIQQVQAVQQEAQAVQADQKRKSARLRKIREIWSPERQIRSKTKTGRPRIGLGLLIMLLCVVHCFGCQPSFRPANADLSAAAVPMPATPCSMRCSARGVTAVSHKKLDKLEICCPDGCWAIIPKSTEVNYELPAEELIHGYHCDGKCWLGPGPPFNFSQRCPAREECELINCIFCWEQLANPTCNPKWSSALFGFGSALVLAILGCVCPILGRFWSGATLFSRAVAWGAQYPIRLINWITGRHIAPPTTEQVEQKVKKGARLARREIKEVQQRLQLARRARAMARAWREPDRERGAYPGRAMTAAVPLLLLIGTAAAVKPISVMVRSEDCSRTSAGLKCAGTAATVLTLLPADQINSFVIRTPQDELLGAVRLRLASISMLCVAKTESWLRSYSISTVAVKRCPSAGSCHGNACSAIRNGVPIPELVALNHRPGHSFCMRSTSFWHNSCGLPSASCLFYRWAAVPTASTVFEEFSCLEWDLQIDAWVELETNKGQVESHRLTIHPGVPEQWGNMTIAVIPTSLPPLPALSAHFVTDGRAVAMGKPIPSDLHCPDEESARGFDKCRLSIGACQKCAPDHDNGTVHCHCRDLEVGRVLEDPEQQLPLDVARLHIHNHGPNVRAEFQYSPVQVHVQLNGLELISEYDNTKCWVENPKLSGCYRCVTGATFNATCRTDYGTALAKIKCADGTLFALHCGGNGTTTTESVSFDRAEVFTECQVKCPAGATTFRLQGELVFIPRQQQFGFNQRDSSGGRIEPGGNFVLPNWEFDPFPLLRMLMNGPWLLVAIGAGVIALAALFLYIKFNPHFRMYRALLTVIVLIIISTFITTAEGGLPFSSTNNFLNFFSIIHRSQFTPHHHIYSTQHLAISPIFSKHFPFTTHQRSKRQQKGTNAPSDFSTGRTKTNRQQNGINKEFGLGEDYPFLLILFIGAIGVCLAFSQRLIGQRRGAVSPFVQTLSALIIVVNIGQSLHIPTISTRSQSETRKEGTDDQKWVLRPHQQEKALPTKSLKSFFIVFIFEASFVSLIPFSNFIKGTKPFIINSLPLLRLEMSEFANDGFGNGPPKCEKQNGGKFPVTSGSKERKGWGKPKPLPPKPAIRTVADEVEQLGEANWTKDPWGRAAVERFLRKREQNGWRMVHERGGQMMPVPFVLGLLPAHQQQISPGWNVASYFKYHRMRALRHPEWACIFAEGGVVGSSRRSRARQRQGHLPWRYGHEHAEWLPLEELIFCREEDIDDEYGKDGAVIEKSQIGKRYEENDDAWHSDDPGTEPGNEPEEGGKDEWASPHTWTESESGWQQGEKAAFESQKGHLPGDDPIPPPYRHLFDFSDVCVGGKPPYQPRPVPSNRQNPAPSSFRSNSPSMPKQGKFPSAPREDGLARYQRRMRQVYDLCYDIEERESRLLQLQAEQKGQDELAQTLRNRQQQAFEQFERNMKRLWQPDKERIWTRFPGIRDSAWNMGRAMDQHEPSLPTAPSSRPTVQSVVVVPPRRDPDDMTLQRAEQRQKEVGSTSGALPEDEGMDSKPKEKGGEGQVPPAAEADHRKPIKWVQSEVNEKGPSPKAPVVGWTTHRPMAEWDDMEWTAQQAMAEEKAKQQAEEDEKRWARRLEEAKMALEGKMRQILEEAKTKDQNAQKEQEKEKQKQREAVSQIFEGRDASPKRPQDVEVDERRLVIDDRAEFDEDCVSLASDTEARGMPSRGGSVAKKAFGDEKAGPSPPNRAKVLVFRQGTDGKYVGEEMCSDEEDKFGDSARSIPENVRVRRPATHYQKKKKWGNWRR